MFYENGVWFYLVQVLTWFDFFLIQVKWARENYHHHIGSPYSLRLASADANGKIIVWDVAAGAAQCEIREHARPIQGEGVCAPPSVCVTTRTPRAGFFPHSLNFMTSQFSLDGAYPTLLI